MKFKTWRASNLSDKGEVQIKTIKELMDLVDKEGSLIVGRSLAKEEPEIIFYDSYME